MKKPHDFFEQLQDPAFRDRKSAVQLNANPERLTFAAGKRDGNWQSIAASIRQPSPWSVQWFPDSNIAFLPETEVIWDALRTTGMGIEGGVANLTPVAVAEMDEWLKLPYRLQDRAKEISDAIQSGSWLRTIKKPGFPYGLGIRGYMQLLGLRRGLAGPLADGSTFVGTDAADKCKTMNEIEARMGRRALGLAKKGRVDRANKGLINVSDELHCLIVIANALLKAEESIILTADEDYIEIFGKAAWLFDTHYRAWLAASLVKEGLYGAPLTVVEDTSGFFKGPLTVYRRPTPDLQEVLPMTHEPVRVAVIYVTPHGQIQFLAFAFERRMLDMLKMRGATNGRCTNLFGTANIHVDIAPLRLGLNDLCLGVGQDEGIEVQSLEHTMFLSKLDLIHCIYCKERFAS